MSFHSAEEVRETLKSSVLGDMEYDPGQNTQTALGGDGATLSC